MTDRKKELSERLSRGFEVCGRHLRRMREALTALGVKVPISVGDYRSFNEEQVRCVDQFIFRFSKLQDEMGQKLFRYVLEYLDEDIASLPMRDVLNRLERYHLIANAGEWMYLRELRNEIAHDYPLSEEDVAAALSELIMKTTILEDIYKRLKEAVKDDCLSA